MSSPCRLAPVALLFAIVVAGCATATPAPTVVSEPTAPPTEIATSTPVPPPTFTPVPPPTLAPTVTPTAVPLSVTPLPSPTRVAPASRPVAVVVENDPVARPQAGLADADVVYEAVAEWYLTRFVAVFLDSDVPTVGPVRSARAYHAAIAAEYQGVLAHCLDVPPVGGVVAATKVYGLDGCRMTNPPGFWRDWNRLAPHNLFVTTADIRRAAGGAGTYGGLGQRAGWPTVVTPSSGLKFVYPTDHPVEWRYDAARGEYLRWQDGEPHVTSDGRQVSATTVVVQQVPVQDSRYFGESGYHELTITGQGAARVFAAGSSREVTWRRPSLGEPTRYYDAAGSVVLLPPGKVFVQLVEKGTRVDEAR